MPNHCECGMHLDPLAPRSYCRDCERAACRSCTIHVEHETYCRWCATAFLAV